MAQTTQVTEETKITTTDNKMITLTKTISVGGVIVKELRAEINHLSKSISFSDWINDMNLYKANRTEIRKIENEFEDAAFAEQDKLEG